MHGFAIDLVATLDAVVQPVCVLDREARITFLNRSAAQALGVTLERALGADFHARHRHSMADGAARAREACPIVRAAASGVRHESADSVLWRADGTVLAVEYSAVALLVDGLLQGTIVNFRDRGAEQRIRQRTDAQLDALRTQLAATEAERDYLRGELSRRAAGLAAEPRSPAMVRTLERIEAAALSSATVLLHGETGTGKTALARHLHRRSYRQDRPFVVLRCAGDGLEFAASEASGPHLARAIRDALALVRAFRLADGGSLVLEHVDRASGAVQQLIERAVVEGVARAEHDDAADADVRVLATVTGDGAGEPALERLREPLAYRLTVLTVGVPALRQRGEDLAALAQAALDAVCRELGRERVQLSARQHAALARHRWPGNLAELHAVMLRAALGTTGHGIDLDGVLADPVSPDRSPAPGAAPVRTERELRAMEKANLLAGLRHTDGRVAGERGAARLLGIKPSTLAYRLKVFGIADAARRRA